MHILQTPDADERKKHAMVLSEELAQYERPQPVMDEYDCLLATEAIQ